MAAVATAVLPMFLNHRPWGRYSRSAPANWSATTRNSNSSPPRPPTACKRHFARSVDHRSGEQLDERGRLYLRQIVEGGEHMKRLMDDLLAFSRVHTGWGDLLPVDAGAVFDVAAGRPGEGAPPGTGLTREDLPVVLAEVRQLDRLLQNLIANRLKDHREGVPARVRVRAERGGEMWRFAVTDNGIGIEPESFGRVLVIFQRLHGREEYEGTGVGLAVCRQIVERHGGRLWLESTPGRASTFLFTLPPGSGGAPAAPAAGPGSSPGVVPGLSAGGGLWAGGGCA